MIFITIHQEYTTRLFSCIQKIKKQGVKAGVVLSPGTSETEIEYVLNQIDMALLMTVNPGESGQYFLPDILPKIKRVKEMIGDRSIDIEVDGGIDNANIGLCKNAGANIFVSGGYLFKEDMADKKKEPVSPSGAGGRRFDFYRTHHKKFKPSSDFARRLCA